jgi:hypothetical protein
MCCARSRATSRVLVSLARSIVTWHIGCSDCVTYLGACAVEEAHSSTGFWILEWRAWCGSLTTVRMIFDLLFLFKKTTRPSTAADNVGCVTTPRASFDLFPSNVISLVNLSLLFFLLHFFFVHHKLDKAKEEERSSRSRSRHRLHLHRSPRCGPIRRNADWVALFLLLVLEGAPHHSKHDASTYHRRSVQCNLS